MAPAFYARYVPPSSSYTVQSLPQQLRENVEEETPKKEVNGSKRKRELGHEKSVKRRVLKAEYKASTNGEENEGSPVGPAESQAAAVIATIKNKMSKAKDKNASSDKDSKEAKRLASPGKEQQVINKSKKSRSHQKRKDKDDSIDGRNGQEQIEVDKHISIRSKFEKSLQKSEATQVARQDMVKENDEQPPELHGLEPIEAPPPDSSINAKPSFSALPPWMQTPVRVGLSEDSGFDDLLVDHQLLKQLSIKGFSKALPIQTVVLPLLLPIETQHPGDVCISAATGSGKTLAYILPIIQSLKNKQTISASKLRAVVIVPTRELVTQVRQVAETCAVGSGLQVATAVGTHSLKSEQDLLVRKEARFDAAGYQELEERLDKVLRDEEEDSDEDFNFEENMQNFAELPFGCLPMYSSKADILICTPGRLVDHIENTRGFSVSNLEWLVIDEADKLLDQDFQQWTQIVLRSINAVTARQRHVDKDPVLSGLLRNSLPRRVRKVILSATMTRDLDKLNLLQLWNPKLVLLEDTVPRVANQNADNPESYGSLMLPSTLVEHAVPVQNSSDKPLYLLRLLLHLFAGDHTQQTSKNKKYIGKQIKSDGATRQRSSSLDSDVDSDTSSIAGSQSDEADSLNSPLSDASSQHIDTVATLKPGKRHLAKPLGKSVTSNALIFTSSNESCMRLSALLAHLEPSLASRIATLTKSTSASQTKQTLSRFSSGALAVIIATDRASRGLDLPTLASVVNYDIPRSVTSYVHRVGRTARAGKHGEAWTLVEDREAGWFWNVIGKGSGGEIQRHGRKLERVRLHDVEQDKELREKYEIALDKLRDDVRGT